MSPHWQLSLPDASLAGALHHLEERQQSTFESLKGRNLRAAPALRRVRHGGAA